MKRTIPLLSLLLALVLLALPFLSSCSLMGRGEEETEPLPPVETEPPVPLFSWEEPAIGDTAEPVNPNAPAELRDFGALPPASTTWASLTEGEDVPRDGLFTRAATALVTEQLVRYCMDASWLSADFQGISQRALTSFLVSTFRYRNVSGYPTYLASLLDWDAEAKVYTVSDEAADPVARGLFGYTDSPTETDTGFGYDLLTGRYEFGSGTIARTPYEISELRVSSDEISTEARFHVIEVAGGRRTDRGEYRIFFYRPSYGGQLLPRMLWLKKGAALTAAEAASEPPITKDLAAVRVPSFLPADAQALYRRAKALYPILVGAPAEAVDLLPLNDGEPYLPGTYYGLVQQTGGDGVTRTYFFPRGRYTNFYAFNTVLTSIFSWSFTGELTGTRYISIDGRLAADTNAGRAPRTDYLPDLDDFELIEAADWKIDFWYYSFYGDPEHPTAERSLMTLLNTDIGWRFSAFTTGEYATGEPIEREVPAEDANVTVLPLDTPPAPVQPTPPAETPTDTPADSPVENPAQNPAETPAEDPGTPAETPAETPPDEDDWWDPPAVDPADLPFDVSGTP